METGNGNNNGKATGWNEWSMHVLKELERLNQNYEALGNKIDGIKSDVGEDFLNVKNEITKVKALQYSISDIKKWKMTYEDEAVLKTVKEQSEWKAEIDNIISPKQLESLVSKVETIDKFKTQVITIFLVAQVVTGILISLIIK